MISQGLEQRDRPRQANLILVVAAIALLSAIAFVPGGPRFATFATHGPLLGALLAVLAAALSLRAWDGAHAALVVAFYLGAYCIPVVDRLWRRAVFAGIVPFAMLNAAFEEIVWRGILWQGVDHALGKNAALAITSLSFGLAHFRGFPSGVLGMALATIYGVMMGLVRIRTAGLLGPWLAHVVADVAIYSMVAVMVVA